MKQIDFCAREPHFADHLIPTYLALPKDRRGRFYTGGGSPESAATALRLDAVDIRPVKSDPLGSSRLTVAASYRDLKVSRKAGRPVVMCEHGAGQGYKGVRSGSYIGAEDRDGVVAALVPGEHAAERQRGAHPSIPVYAVGCPKLDARHRAKRRARRGDPTVAISFHWNCMLAPETRSAVTFYRAALEELNTKFNLIGHGHPRIWTRMKRIYGRLGIEAVESFDEVMDRADVYCVDNSSTLFEFASLDRPVVVLNAPFYRRSVDHGMRFWEFADIGIQVDRRWALAPAIESALQDPPEIAERRREIVSQVYGRTDGKAAERAAQALIEIAG